MSPHTYSLRAIAALALMLMLPGNLQAAEQVAAPVDGSDASSSGQKSRYTEDEARLIMSSHGYNGVGRLRLDEHMVWHATAIQYGVISKVEVDQRGNFTARSK